MSTEGREQLSEEFYDTLEKIMDKVNKNHYIILIGEMHVSVQSGKRLVDVCIFNNFKIINIFLRHKNTQKFTREAKGHKSITDRFITNMKTSKLKQDMRVYRSTELERSHYLICAEVNCPHRWLNKKKKVSVRQEFFKNKTSKRKQKWRYRQTAKRHLNNIKIHKTDVQKEWENLQNILKAAPYKSLGKIKRRNKRKYLKIRDDQIKEFLQAKIWLALKTLEYKIAHQRTQH